VKGKTDSLLSFFTPNSIKKAPPVVEALYDLRKCELLVFNLYLIVGGVLEGQVGFGH
jgi:hypothetical protein